MPVVILASILIALNLILWIVFAARFKKIFTTEDIINETRNELNDMLKKINQNADNNIELIEDRISKLKQVSAKADRSLAILRKELDKIERSEKFQEKLNSLNFSQAGQTQQNVQFPSSVQSQQSGSLSQTGQLPQNQGKASVQSQGQYYSNVYAQASSNVSESAGQKSKLHPKKHTKQSFEELQGKLFGNEKEDETLRAADRALFAAAMSQMEMPPAEPPVPSAPAAPQAESFKRIPIVVPEVYMADTPIPPKKDFATQVRELHALGESDETIAIKLQRSVQEVKFALEF